MAIPKMGSTNKTIGDEVSILKRAGIEAIPMSLDSTAFTDHVCKAGTPIGANGVIKNDGDCLGILLHDVYDDRPQGTILKKAYLDNAKVTASYGTAIASTAKAVLPMIVFE